MSILRRAIRKLWGRSFSRMGPSRWAIVPRSASRSWVRRVPREQRVRRAPRVLPERDSRSLRRFRIRLRFRIRESPGLILPTWVSSCSSREVRSSYTWDRARVRRVLRMHTTREVILPTKPRSLDRREPWVRRERQVRPERREPQDPLGRRVPPEPPSQLSRPRGIPA